MIFKARFETPYTEYNGRNGQYFDVIEIISEPKPGYDAEVLPMYRIQFEDGTIIDAWPEEVEETEEIKKAEETKNKTCPFCFSNELSFVEESSFPSEFDGFEFGNYVIRCDYCGAKGPPHSKRSLYKKEKKALAFKFWNTRKENGY